MSEITLIKGDDTNWNDQQSFLINIKTSLDLSEGFSAEFTLGNIKKEFDQIIDNKIYPILSNKETSTLPLGYMNGVLKIFDSEKRIKTIKSNIPFIIKGGVFTSNSEIEADGENLPTEQIDVTVEDTEIIDYNSLVHKPTLNGYELKGDVTLENIGLGNVNNTSDLDKPISTATQEALDLKADKTEIDPIKQNVNDLQDQTEELITELDNKLDTETFNNFKKDSDNKYAEKTAIPTKLPNPETLTIKYNGQTTFTYDGSKSEIGNFIVNAETVPLSADEQSITVKQELDKKVNSDSLSTVATSGSYNDLTNKPSIPEAYTLPTASTTTLGGVKIDGNTITISDGVISAKQGTTGITDYSALTNKPQINSIELSGNKTLQDLGIQASGDYALNSSIPTKVSQLQNDSNYLTSIPEEYVTTSELSTELDKKQNKLTAGSNITISEDNVISATSSGGTGTSNYTELENKPSINSVTLEGNKTLTELNIPSKDETWTKDNLLSSNDIKITEKTSGYGIDENTLMYLKCDDNLSDSSLNASTFKVIGEQEPTIVYGPGKFNKGIISCTGNKLIGFTNTSVSKEGDVLVDFWFKLPKLHSELAICLSDSPEKSSFADASVIFGLFYQYHAQSQANALFAVAQHKNSETLVASGGILTDGYIGEDEWVYAVFGKYTDSTGNQYTYAFLNGAQIYNEKPTVDFPNESFNSVFISTTSSENDTDGIFNIDELRINNSLYDGSYPAEQYTPVVHTGKYELLKGSSIADTNSNNYFNGYNTFTMIDILGMNFSGSQMRLMGNGQGKPFTPTIETFGISNGALSYINVTSDNNVKAQIGFNLDSEQQTSNIDIYATTNDSNGVSGIKIVGGNGGSDPKNCVELISAEPQTGDNSTKIPSTKWVNNAITTALSSSTPENVVTTDTVQNISGQKTFSSDVILDANKAIISSGNNNVIKLDSDNNKILIGNNDGMVTTLASYDVCKAKIRRDNDGQQNITEENILTSEEITKIKKLTIQEYDSLDPKNENTLYIAIGDLDTVKICLGSIILYEK